MSNLRQRQSHGKMPGRSWMAGTCKLDSPDLFATVSSKKDMRDTETAQPQATKNSVSTVENTTNQVPAPDASAESKPTESKAESKIESKPASENPLDTYIINSWWKIGAGRDALDSNIDECVAKLGEAHKPDLKKHQFTRGMILCMREKGWRDLQSTQ